MKYSYNYYIIMLRFCQEGRVHKKFTTQICKNTLHFAYECAIIPKQPKENYSSGEEAPLLRV